MNATALTRTKAWFAHYQGLLEDRSTYRRQMRGAPYFAIYNVGAYTFAPWKVIWPEMSNRFYAAVAGSATIPTGEQKPYIPDHKVYFAAFSKPKPAYYLCALLNAPMVKEWIESHNVSIQVGDVFKHMNLPEYDGKDPRHLRVAELTRQAHEAQSSAARADLVDQIEPLTEEILLAWVGRS